MPVADASSNSAQTKPSTGLIVWCSSLPIGSIQVNDLVKKSHESIVRGVRLQADRFLNGLEAIRLKPEATYGTSDTTYDCFSERRVPSFRRDVRRRDSAIDHEFRSGD